MISWNLFFGPDKEEFRYHQMKQHLQHLYSTATPATTPLFVELAPRIIEAMVRLNYEFSSDSPKEDQAWKWLAQRAAFLKTGKRAHRARFQSVSATCAANVDYWAIQLFERTYVALEEDFLCGAAYVSKFALKTGKSDVLVETGPLVINSVFTHRCPVLQSVLAPA